MVLALRGGSRFSVVQEYRSGYPKHCVLYLGRRAKDVRPEANAGHLGSREAVVELKEEILPAYMKWAEITDLRRSGFRLAVEAPSKEGFNNVHLIAGSDEVPLLGQNPQDWLSPPVDWNPDVESAPFFDNCAAAAAHGRRQMAFGNQMLYPSKSRAVFGVVDGDPKSDVHFLVLARQPFSSIGDPGFTTDHMVRFFEVAYALCERLGINEQGVRLVANTGQGAQVGPRVHMHVQSSADGLPSMFPFDYNFGITPAGVIQKYEGYELHETVMGLIRERQAIEGFSPEAKEARHDLDQQLLALLKQIKQHVESRMGQSFLDRT